MPLAVYAAGVLLYSTSPGLFWRALAYVAVFHFVRQQYGWVALYRRRLGDHSTLDRVLDDAAIYSATLYPLLHWHANLPREFEWFIAGDFIPGLPREAAHALLPVHLGIMAAYAARQVWLLAHGRPVSPGKNVVVATTWAAWFVGIVVLDSDYAFTVTNVLVHGIPYLALVWVYGRSRYASASGLVARAFRPGALGALPRAAGRAGLARGVGLGSPALARAARLFPGADISPGPEALALIVPLLALPQATHYVLDGWIWRTRGNPHLRERLGF